MKHSFQTRLQRMLLALTLALAAGWALALPSPKDIEAAVGAGQLPQAETMLRETVRVGRVGILAFPNFAHWFNRLSVLQGRMPVTRRLPYQWYDTPNIRVGTYADFGDLARKNQLQVVDAFGLQNGQEVRLLPNLMAGTAVYKLQRG